VRKEGLAIRGRRFWNKKKLHEGSSQKCVAEENITAPAHTQRALHGERRQRLAIFNLPRCTSAELFFSCCNSVAALALANCNEHAAEANITAPAHTQRALHGAQGS
jgi:hypothetical protein